MRTQPFATLRAIASRFCSRRSLGTIRPTRNGACRGHFQFNQATGHAHPLALIQTCRFYGESSTTLDDANERVLSVLKKFDKVDASKLSLTAPFTQLGLDSLDVVEVMIALEEEFHMEIPDPVADKVQTPKEVAEYIYGFLNPHQPPKEDHMSEPGSH